MLGWAGLGELFQGAWWASGPSLHLALRCAFERFLLSIVVLFYQRFSTIITGSININYTSHLRNNECKWRDGFCGSKAFWRHHRDRQQLGSAELLPRAGRGPIADCQRSSRHLCSKSRMALKCDPLYEFENYHFFLFLSWFLIQGSQYHFSKSKSYLSQTGGEKWNLGEKIKVTKSRNSLNTVIKPPSSLSRRLKDMESL